MTQSRNVYRTGDAEVDRILDDLGSRLDVIEGLRPDLSSGLYQLDSAKNISTTLDGEFTTATINSNLTVSGTLTVGSTLDVGTSTDTSVVASPTLVNNSNGNPNISDTLFTFYGVITKSSWESIGPTGAGADNTWTALDNVPTDADWIYLKVRVDGYESGGAADTARSSSVHMRRNGSSQGNGTDNQVGLAQTYTSSNGNCGSSNITAITVPVNAAVFDAFWNSNYATTQEVVLVLLGYGYNP